VFILQGIIIVFANLHIKKIFKIKMYKLWLLVPIISLLWSHLTTILLAHKLETSMIHALDQQLVRHTKISLTKASAHTVHKPIQRLPEMCIMF
jgi:hypothetical protein